MKEETVLSLKWHSFPSHLAVSLDTCYEKQQFVDVSLVCKGGTTLKCHKMVLANSSTFFRRLLVANDHPHPMIILHDIEADDLKTIITFMYCGEIQVVQSEVRRLLKLAEILEVTGLRHIQTSVLAGEANNSSHEVPKKTTTVSRLKIEDSKNQASTKPGSSDYELRSKSQSKISPQPGKLCPSSHTYKNVSKSKALDQDVGKKSGDNSINVLNQRLETGKSGISIIGLNDMPSTSRGLQNPLPSKRKDPDDSLISWPKILSAISKDKQLPFKKLCIMDEVEITPGKPPTPLPNPEQNEPLDRRKLNDALESNTSMKCAVFIKDEIDITSELEEDIDMDPLEVEEIESDNMENVVSKRLFPFTGIKHGSYSGGALPDFPPKRGSNG